MGGGRSKQTNRQTTDIRTYALKRGHTGETHSQTALCCCTRQEGMSTPMVCEDNINKQRYGIFSGIGSNCTVRTITSLGPLLNIDTLSRSRKLKNDSKIFTSPYRPDRLWGPPNLL
jgi:hypothetical protein